MGSFKIIAGSASVDLARSVARRFNMDIVNAEIGKFPNGETRIEIKESVRKSDVFVIQSTCPPVNDNLMELMILIDALKRASAGFITAVIPYFGYAKQDKKKEGREPISSKLVARMLEMVGVKRVVTFDLHAAQIEGFFDIAVENLTAINMIAEHFKKKQIRNTVVVAPDAGGVKRARDLANAMNANRLAIIDKYREDYRKAAAMNVVGKVAGMNAIIIDDFIDTGGSMVEAIKAVKNHNAKKVWVACTHPILTNPAEQRFRKIADQIEELIVTDTIPLRRGKTFPKIKVLSTANILGDAIRRISGGRSLRLHRASRN